MLRAAASISLSTRSRMALVSLAAHKRIDVDFAANFLLQVVFFVALTLFLKPVLFDPMLKLFEERERRTFGAKVQARKIDEKSAGAAAKYDAEMGKARAAAGAERDKIRAAAVKEEQELLAQVRVATAKVIDDGKAAAFAEAERARAALKADAAQRARELARRGLG